MSSSQHAASAGQMEEQQFRDSSQEHLSTPPKGIWTVPPLIHRSSSDKQRARHDKRRNSAFSQTRSFRENKDQMDASSNTKVGAVPGSVGGSSKLGTFSGVFVPVTLNVLSILMFLRFGFILGQSGLIGMMTMLALAYMADVVTTLSLSAISTNGTVRGGGAYYLISRSLGPEFGGAIGTVFYLGIDPSPEFDQILI